MSDDTAAGSRYGEADDEAIALLTEEAEAKTPKNPPNMQLSYLMTIVCRRNWIQNLKTEPRLT